MGVFVCFWNSTLMTQKDQAIFAGKPQYKNSWELVFAIIFFPVFYSCSTWSKQSWWSHKGWDNLQNPRFVKHFAHGHSSLQCLWKLLLAFLSKLTVHRHPGIYCRWQSTRQGSCSKEAQLGFSHLFPKRAIFLLVCWSVLIFYQQKSRSGEHL